MRTSALEPMGSGAPLSPKWAQSSSAAGPFFLASLTTLWAVSPEGVPPIHLTPQQAGECAAKARARRLLLTHLRPGGDPAAATARAAEAYGGPVGVATELEVHRI